MVRFIPLKTLPTVLETADLLFRHVFRQFGLPEDIMSDRGPQFTSQIWKELLGKLNIMVSLTSGYHPQANGQAERTNQELGNFLCLYCQHHPETWSAYLPWAEYAQNSLHHAVETWCKESERTWEERHPRLHKAIAAFKLKADRMRRETPQYDVGQKVYVSSRDGHAGATGKLAAKYEGPYRVMERINEVTYWVGLAGCNQASSTFHVSALKPVTQGPLAREADSSIDLPLPLSLEGDKVSPWLTR
ncbi:hypothetical protein P4O66_013038 [Electrophorus voltai]|uniref:Integrase catalytic domain-containing protein n=1 Tax=Electrophorus voltai TaxID=2609070 RepID=A0AAD9E6A5_9TELE|nr:hypothetical protein P4O66_013038 [Electrophorus voltai]